MSFIMNPFRYSVGGYAIDNSVRYNDDDSPYLYRTPFVAGNRKEGTISLWYKRSNLGSIMQLFSSGDGDDIAFDAANQLIWTDSSGLSYKTTQVFRDTTAWGHLVLAWDTSLAAAGNRARIYHNGVEITDFATETHPDQNDELEISNTVRQTIGANENNIEEFDGYLSEIHYVDGQQLTPTSFGEFDDNGVWRPIEYSATTTTPAISHVSDDSTGVNATTFTFSSQALGAAASDRRIVVAVGAGGGSVGTASGVTVGGVTATQVVHAALDVEANSSIWWAAVPTGTTGDVVVTFTSSKGNCGVSCYRLTGADMVLSTATDVAAGSGAASLGTVGTPDNAVVVGNVYLTEGGGATRTNTWAGLTENLDDEIEGGSIHSTASGLITSALVSATATPSGSTSNEVFTLASFGSSAYGTNGFSLDFADSSELGLFATGANALTNKASAVGEWIGDTGDFTFSGDDIVGANDKEIHLPGFFTGDCEVEFTIASGGSNYGAVGFFDATEVGSVASSGGIAGMQTMTNSWYFEPDATLNMDLPYGGSDQANFDYTDGQTMKMTRVGSTFKVYEDGVLQHTYSQEFSGPVGLAVGGHSQLDLEEFNWSGDNYGQFISSGLAAADQVSDSPTTNFATYNPLYILGSGATFSDGNLVHNKASTGYAGAASTIPIPTTGKWAFKIKVTGSVGGSNDGALGIFADAAGNFLETGSYVQSTASWYNAVTIEAYSDGGFRYNFDNAGMVEHFNGPAVSTNDEFEFLVDRDAGTVDIKKNGSAYGTQLTGLPDDTQMWPGSVNYATNTTATFDYTPSDTTYKTLCVANLPTPTIPDGTAHFQTTLYTGNGSARNIDQTGNSTFQPDIVWIKNRDTTDQHMLFDAARGVTKDVNVDALSGENTNADGLTSFDSDGFGLGSGAGGYNDSTEKFVAHQWKAGGGAGSSNTVGDINTTTTTVNTTAGISVGTYTGTGNSGDTVGHGLGVAPSWVYVYSRAATSRDGTIFSLGNAADTNTSSESYFYWAFAEIAGFSRMGLYEGNAQDDGSYVYCGFKPAWIWIKNFDTAQEWHLYNSAVSPFNSGTTGGRTYNRTENPYADNVGGSENIDFLSNGFKMRCNCVGTNKAETHAFMAFAEYPFGGDGVTPATAV
jgi:hypothetical protein